MGAPGTAASNALLLLLTATAGGCMTAKAESEGENAGGAPGTACALTVRFGSYAMGIDGAAAQSVEKLLRADRAVQAVERRPWGREGEFDLCARIARPSEAKRLFDRIRSLLPAKPRGPVTVQLADGRSYGAPPQ
ncbi:MAG TPA: hypothetical protein VF631_07960 [Allosphingosinicella sp.]|jgi:hypothetical protein|uniref:hypothetical protein n=1 Tax=Allosphingosinicella sp. TaxID=2823234 RepID=UPI002F299D3F